jgi:hypothetical protein
MLSLFIQAAARSPNVQDITWSSGGYWNNSEPKPSLSPAAATDCLANFNEERVQKAVRSSDLDHCVGKHPKYVSLYR